MREKLQELYNRLQDDGEAVAAAQVEALLAHINDRIAQGRPIKAFAGGTGNGPPSGP